MIIMSLSSELTGVCDSPYQQNNSMIPDKLGAPIQVVSLISPITMISLISLSIWITLVGLISWIFSSPRAKELIFLMAKMTLINLKISALLWAFNIPDNP